jgi:hypothetical protein
MKGGLIAIAGFLIALLMVPMASAITDPYIISGTVYYNGYPTSGITVTITDTRTSDTLTAITDGSGQYIENLINMPSSWQNGDSITVTATYLGQSGSGSATVTSGNSGSSVDIRITGGGGGGGGSRGLFSIIVKVVDANSLKPISGARISVTSADGNSEGISDSGGEASISVSDGANHFTITKSGYTPYVASLIGSTELTSYINTFKMTPLSGAVSPWSSIPGSDALVVIVAFAAIITIGVFRRKLAKGVAPAFVALLIVAQMFIVCLPASSPAGATTTYGDWPYENIEWWNSSWNYGMQIYFSSSLKDRENVTPYKVADLTQYWLQRGITGVTLDENSIRMVEYNSDGSMIVFNSSASGGNQYLVSLNWTKAAGYNHTTNALINVTWMVSGITPALTTRVYMLYFDSTDDGVKPSPTVNLVFWNDVAVANWNPYANSGYLYLNTDGVIASSSIIQPTVTYSTPNASNVVDSGDFNGDGYLDIVFPAWFAGPDIYDPITPIFSGGSGGPDNVVDWELHGNGIFGGGVGDVNGDGIDDIVLCGLRNASNYGVGSLLFYGSVDGPSSTADHFFNTNGSNDAAIADVNHDGLNDIIFTCCFNNASTSNINSFVYLNNESGFNLTPDIEFPTHSAYAVQAADLNRDGWVDLVFANRRNTSMPEPQRYQINSSIYYNNEGTFNLTPDVELPTLGAIDVKATDVNNDGWLDLVFANYYDGVDNSILSYVYVNSNGTFSTTPAGYIQTAWAYGVAAGDINNDGYVDLAFANYYDGISTDTYSRVVYGPCIGLPQLSTFFATHGAGDVCIADFDRYNMTRDVIPPVVSLNGPSLILETGWNLVSMPLSGITINGTAIINASTFCAAVGLRNTQVTAKISGDYVDYIQGESVTDIGFYDGIGLYVWVSDNTTLPIDNGTLYDEAELTLNTGWNLVGVAAPQLASEYCAFSSHITAIVGDIGASGHQSSYVTLGGGRSFGDDFMMVPGFAYFVFTNASLMVYLNSP